MCGHGGRRGMKPTNAERLFQLRRFRRRMQASGMLAVAAVALTVGMAIPRDRYPSLFVFFWCGVMLLVVWMLLLAVGDAVSTSLHANRLRREHRIETARLKAEMERLLQQRAEGGNGHAGNGSGRHSDAGEHNGRAHTPPEE
jgi:hypothetical protein